MKITLEKKHLIDAFQKYNLNYLENPEKFSEVDDAQECAEAQADYVLSLIPEGTMEEVRADIVCDTVAEFIAFCDEKGTPLPDGYFEEFFGA